MRILLIFVGIISLVSSMVLLSNRYVPLLPEALSSSMVIQGSAQRPTHLKLTQESESIELVPSQIQNQTWETSQTGASILTNPSLLGLSDTSIVIYGHNWPRLLGKLHELKEGDVFYLKIQGSWQEMQIQSQSIVGKSDLGPLYAADTKSVIVYTCAGFLDSKRLVVLAKPTDYRAI